MNKYISIVLMLCFLCSIHAKADTLNQSSNVDSDGEVVNSDALETSCNGVTSLLRRPSYGAADINLSTPARISWFESKEDSAQVSVEGEETQVKPRFNWKACCIAGGCVAVLIVFVAANITWPNIR